VILRFKKIEDSESIFGIFETITELKEVDISDESVYINHSRAYVDGVGEFVLRKASTLFDDGSSIIEPAIGTGRWIKIAEANDDNLVKLVLETKNSTGGGVLERDIIVAGVTVGNFSSGDTLNKGTSITTILEDMLIKKIAATYAAPTGTLSSTESGDIEIGSTVSPSLSASFTQRDGGALTKYVLKRGTTTLVDNATIITHVDNNQSIGSTALSYQATFSYNDGSVKNNNVGEASPTGQIKAGSVTSNTISITGRRNAFYGIDGQITTSAQIRAYTGKVLNPVEGTTFTIEVPKDSVTFEFAYPATLRDVSKLMHDDSNFDIKSSSLLSKTTVNVEGANGFTAIAYKVYRLTPTQAWSTAQKYTITI
jgi:hypothetical protein